MNKQYVEGVQKWKKGLLIDYDEPYNGHNYVGFTV